MLNNAQPFGIKNILSKYELEPEHTEQVRKLSLQLFDQLNGVFFNYSVEENLLEAVLP
ncbi:MAG: hypothetical protein M0C28_17935 [Candidatus Moduliflexus flocculans]|nr:hypothetical protein [Candidatus Moduliflexus flocculans]